jgi:hypothetical protein
VGVGGGGGGALAWSSSAISRRSIAVRLRSAQPRNLRKHNTNTHAHQTAHPPSPSFTPHTAPKDLVHTCPPHSSPIELEWLERALHEVLRGAGDGVLLHGPQVQRLHALAHGRQPHALLLQPVTPQHTVQLRHL